MKSIKILLPALLILPMLLNATEPDYNQLNDAAKENLINLININTAQPEPQETYAVRYIYKVLNRNKIDWDIYREIKTRGNLIAVLKADKDYAKTRNESPLIMIAHLDTAPVQEGWTFTPTKATVKDGRIYGLGSTDDKNYAAINLSVLTWLKQNKIKLRRDIIFIFSADEENGSSKGLKFLYEKYPEKLKAGYALNEGGGIIPGANGGKDLLFVEAATKMYMDILITARGDGGHSAMPGQANAIYKLSQALSVIQNYQPQIHISQFTKNFFSKIYAYQDTDARTTISLLNSSDPLQVNQAARIIGEDPFLKTQITDTISPTIVNSGVSNDTSSSEAYATLNCRLLPDSDPVKFFENLKSLFANDSSISLSIIEKPDMPFPQPATEANDLLFKTIEFSAQKVMPGSLTIAGMSPASSDSETLRRHGVIAYGIGPVMPGDTEGPHQANENIEEKDFYQQLKLTMETVLDFTEIDRRLPPPQVIAAQQR
jgi:Acetylornithine deacetylase/Succinyl-diaminopimelate desuccinylase and related deacylases